MSANKSGWPTNPANPAKPGGELAPLAPLAAVTPSAERDGHGRFVTGNNGGGRKKGGRNRLTDTLLTAIENDFAEHGASALAQLRGADPAAYIRIVASLVPRELVMKREQEVDFSDMTRDELAEMYGRAYDNREIRKKLTLLSRDDS